MKKRNVLLLVIICMLTFCSLTGLLVYAFDLQNKKDVEDQARLQDSNELTGFPEEISPSVTVTSPPAKDQPTKAPAATAAPTKAPDSTASDSLRQITLAFAGDVNLDENSHPAAKYDAEGGDIGKCFSSDLLKEMKNADVMMLNNEFAYSTRGTKAADKSYTFRANPGRVNILKKIGTDIVSLANNHALDYGQDALADTFDTLEQAGIDYVGAGRNMNRAKSPIYKTIGGKKIAFLAASRVIFAGDWYATETGAGMVGTYDPSLILESIKEAKKNSDYTVIFVHWGIERENYPVDYQRSLAEAYIDAGADAVVGCHPHVMQGIEYYKGKPIAYSLSNYWFNDKLNQSALLKLYLDPDGAVKVQLLPVMNNNTNTYLLTKAADKKEYYDFIRKLSFDVNIDEDGYITEAK